MKAITIQKVFILFFICSSCCASELDDIAKLLTSGQADERSEAVDLLHRVINDKDTPGEVRSAAVSLAASERVHECVDVIIKHIDNNWVRIKSPMSPEQSYPNIQALMSIGEKSIPSLTDAIKEEDSLLRVRLMSYTLVKIMKPEAALAHLDKLITEEGLTEQARKRLVLSRMEAAKWSASP